MMVTRPDWLISRQRVWGTPLGLFVSKETGEPCLNAKVIDNTVQAFRALGGDAWWSEDDSVFFEGTDLNPNDYNKVMDVLDVWFDSGCTHRLLPGPADLVIEGSDQHRGWFQTSLLVSSLAQGHLPTQGFLTHGFILDANGIKMSKSKGNVISPTEVTNQFGTDVLRLWVATCDFTQDVKASMPIFKATQETYHKVRNTLRYLLGALEDYDGVPVPYMELEPLERYMLNRLSMTNHAVSSSYETFDFASVSHTIVDFIANEMSAFYFDIRKDSLYCDAPDAPRRRGYRYVLNELLNHLCAWLEPIIPFTIDEVRSHREVETLLLTDPKVWDDHPEETTRWSFIKEVLMLARVAQEDERDEIKSNMDARLDLYLGATGAALLSGVNAADVFRVSQVETHFEDPPSSAYAGQSAHGRIGVVVSRAQGEKCARSWRILPEVGQDPEYPDLSLRDAAAVRQWKLANEQ